MLRLMVSVWEREGGRDEGAWKEGARERERGKVRVENVSWKCKSWL